MSNKIARVDIDRCHDEGHGPGGHWGNCGPDRLPDGTVPSHCLTAETYQKAGTSAALSWHTKADLDYCGACTLQFTVIVGTIDSVACLRAQDSSAIIFLVCTFGTTSVTTL